MAKKYVYRFEEGNANMRELLGGKGANLAEMSRMGFPVPPGFTVTTEACTKYYEDGKTIAPEIEEQIFASLAKSEEVIGKKFGSEDDPYLVSVRSGARASMPGMMDTILNLGLTDVSVKGLPRRPTTRILLTTPIAASSRCSPTSLWKSRRASLKPFWTSSRKSAA